MKYINMILSNLRPFFIFALVILQGCAATQTFPNVARAGDTISLAIGSAEGMSKDSSNTTAVYLPDSGGTYPLTIRSVFNLYPDKKSRLYLTNSVTLPVIDSSYHEAWQTVMVVDLPSDVPVGTGKINITSIATYPSISSHINDWPIAIEIVDGVGASHSFSHEFGVGASTTGSLAELESLPHALIKPPVPTTSEYYGAIEMKLSLQTSAAVPLTEDNVRVIVDDMTPRTVSNRNVIWRVNNDELIVMLLSPSGYLQAMESRFSIVLQPRFNFTSEPMINEVSFYDMNGNLVSGLVPSDYSVTLVN